MQGLAGLVYEPFVPLGSRRANARPELRLEVEARLEQTQ
ncbi:MAG: hypothetical protein ANABAC_2880 [Anaerolineae bacterium]|nr:MAG: hypothetical protein ANABAC_2880 [Anaerolineae bacterium]